jgi:hypothetical protein
MSDMGLNSSLYLEMGRLAEAADRAILALRAGKGFPQDDDCLALVQMLIGNKQANCPNIFRNFFLPSITTTGSPGYSWNDLGSDLLVGKTDHRVIAALEIIARALEREQNQTLTRMRGFSG